MFYITQIGLLPIKTIARDAGMLYGVSDQIAGENSPLVSGLDMAWAHEPNRYIRTLTVEGEVLVTGSYTVNKIIRLLQTYKGTPTDVIAFFLQECNGATLPVWVHAQGRIDSFATESQRGGKIRVNLSLTLAAAFKPLNPYLWYYTDSPSADEWVSRPTPSFSNLMENPSFETGDFTGWVNVWNSFENHIITGSPAQPPPYGHTGRFGARLYDVEGAIYQQKGGTILKPNTLYRFSFWLRTGGTINSNTYLKIMRDVGSGYQEYINIPITETIIFVPPATSRWVYYEAEFMTPPTLAGITYRLGAYRTGGSSLGLNVVDDFALVETAALASRAIFPTLEEVVSEDCDTWVWEKRNYSNALLLDVDSWGYLVKGYPAQYPSVGFHIDWTQNRQAIAINGNESIWNYPPHVVYAFTGFQGEAGKLTMTIRAGFDGDPVSFTLDTDIVSNYMVANINSGLEFNDRIIIGDIYGRAAVVRNGQIIAYVAHALSGYRGNFPGALSSGINTVKFTPNASPDMKWSALALWRVS